MREAGRIWIWIWLFSTWLCASALPDWQQDRPSGSVRRVNQTLLDDLPECARTCQQRVLAAESCALTDDCFCASYAGQVYKDAVGCVQTSCPLLVDLLQWQKFRADTCNIKARDLNLAQDLVTSLLFTLVTITVALRFLSRSPQMGGPGYWWDDWVVLAVWIVSINMVVILGLKSRYQAAWDSFATTPYEINNALIWIYACEPAYFTGTYGAKLSLALLYLRVLEGNTWYRRVCWGAVCLCFGGTFGYGIATMASLWPLGYYQGDSAIVRRNLGAINLQTAALTFSAWNVALDFLVLLIPIVILVRLRGITRSWKLGISGVFMAGFIATAFSCVRIYYLIPLKNSTNVPWDFGIFGLWSECEVHISTFCCNLPPLATIINRMMRKRRGIQDQHPQFRDDEIYAANTEDSEVTQCTGTTEVSEFNTSRWTPTGMKSVLDIIGAADRDSLNDPYQTAERGHAQHTPVDTRLYSEEPIMISRSLPNLHQDLCGDESQRQSH